MRYLFFDEEFATSKGGIHKICEFGYIVTDEHFMAVDRNNFIINPAILSDEWDPYVLTNILTRDKNEYEKGFSFQHYYAKIKELIENADFVLGHSTAGDVKALNDECSRYSLPSIDFVFIDVALIHNPNTKRTASIKNLLEKYHIPMDGKEHDAEVDACNTAMICGAVLKEKNLTLDSVKAIIPQAVGYNKEYEIHLLKQNNHTAPQEVQATIGAKFGDLLSLIKDKE